MNSFAKSVYSDDIVYVFFWVVAPIVTTLQFPFFADLITSNSLLFFHLLLIPKACSKHPSEALLKSLETLPTTHFVLMQTWFPVFDFVLLHVYHYGPFNRYSHLSPLWRMCFSSPVHFFVRTLCHTTDLGK